MCRILDFRISTISVLVSASSVTADRVSSHSEAGGLHRRRKQFCLDRIDPRSCGPAANRAFEAREGVGVAFRNNFDLPVGQIADEPGESFAFRRIEGEEAEPDAMHPSRDEIASSLDHAG